MHMLYSPELTGLSRTLCRHCEFLLALHVQRLFNCILLDNSSRGGGGNGPVMPRQPISRVEIGDWRLEIPFCNLQSLISSLSFPKAVPNPSGPLARFIARGSNLKDEEETLSLRTLPLWEFFFAGQQT